MIFVEPKLESDDKRVLEMIREQRARLSSWTQSVPRRWFGSLRRNTFARAIQGSNTIEGYHATLDEAIAAVEDEPPIDEKTETWLAISGYRDAMTYILQACEDPYFEFSKQYLKSLHFMMVGFDLDAFPGRWRPGTVYVVNKATGDTVYDAPDVGLVDPLVKELVAYLAEPAAQSSIVTAGMAHLNLTMIHPFKDGNGRMARALQTLMLTKEGHGHPIFSSIEEWLGRNTDEYYAVLAQVGRGSWNPKNDALPWVRFCFKAHYQQAGTIIRRFDEYNDLFEIVGGIIQSHKLNERMSLPLFDCALGLRMTNARYQKDASVTQYIAGRDLKQIADLELITPHGEKRGRYYVANDILKAARSKVRRIIKVDDPYDLLSKSASEPVLPGF
jgi:Fic family protein